MGADILIIDDDQVITEGFKELLSKHGYNVECAADEREAIYALKEKPYNVVLTDIVLKETTGIELIPKIRELSKDADIIMVTAYPSAESSVQCFRAGASDYLIKPIRKEELLHSIERCQHSKEEAKELIVLKRLKETTEKSSREKNLFLMQVSHDIHKIMDSIIGYNNLMLKTPINDKQAESLNAIKSSSCFLRNLADNILDVARIESEAIQFKHEPFLLDEAIEDIARILYPSVKDKPVQFSYEIDKEIPKKLIGDVDRLKQILLNLLSNAAHFTERGEINLKARLMTILGSGCHVFFIVKDTGPGIKKDRQMDIFKPLFQSSKSSGPHRQSYGLGLWICKILVENMGGLISVHSAIGKGSEFRFSIRFDLPPQN